jgi:hypothetical protein
MKIIIPENLNEITVEQYIKYQRVLKIPNIGNDALIIGTVACFCNLTTDEVLQIDSKEVKEIANKIIDVLQQNPRDITHFGKFSRIPNFDNITSGEYIDLDTFAGDLEKAHKFMAVFYRPKTKQILSDYQIEKYKGADLYEAEMLKAPLEAYLSAMVFFCNLSKELLKATKVYLQQKRTQEVEQLELHLEKNGIGIHQFTQLLEEAILIYEKLLKPTYTNF